MKVSSILTKNPPICLCLATWQNIRPFTLTTQLFPLTEWQFYYLLNISDDEWRQRREWEGVAEDEPGVGETQEGRQVGGGQSEGSI